MSPTMMPNFSASSGDMKLSLSNASSIFSTSEAVKTTSLVWEDFSILVREIPQARQRAAVCAGHDGVVLGLGMRRGRLL